MLIILEFNGFNFKQDRDGKVFLNWTIIIFQQKIR